MALFCVILANSGSIRAHCVKVHVRYLISWWVLVIPCAYWALQDLQQQRQQVGQHPLTGQRAVNFRLLANQWAERRYVRQWRHGCRAMRRSVCNAGASNPGRSLCVQISREQSYPLPIYWYHLKGNWLRYNFATDIFYTMKLCSRLLVLYCRNCPKDANLGNLSPFWGS